MLDLIFSNPLVKLLELGIFHLDDLFFGRRDPYYQPAENMLTFPYLAAVGSAIFYLIMDFFSSVDRQWGMDMIFHLLLCCAGVNVFFYMFNLLGMNSFFKQIFYFCFVSVITFSFTLLIFIIALWAMTILIIIFVTLFFISCLASSSSGSGRSSGGSFGGSSGGSSDSGFVRKNQDAYDLSDGTTVAFDAMTGNYVSTNPLFPAEYEKNNDTFTRIN